MKVYIAGPMTGIPEYNYPAFHEAAVYLRGQGHEVVSPAELHGNDFDRSHDWYLRRDIAFLVECEAVYVLPGWEASKGASLEVTVAKGLSMPVHELIPTTEGMN